MKTSFRTTLALCLLSFSTLAYGGKLPAGFTIGSNEAWIENNYGNWLASNPLFGLPSGFPSSFTCCANNSALSAVLSGIAQGSAKVVRLFLLPAVQGIKINTSVTSPTSTAVTMTQGLTSSCASRSRGRQIEIANAKLALDKSSNENIRAFAAATLKDYATADATALSSLASGNITLDDNAMSQSLFGAASEHAQNLSQLSGAAFDEAYARNELALHVFISGAIEMTLIPSAQSAEVKQLLQNELALYQKHLQEARELVGELQPPSHLPLPPPKHR